MSVSGLIMSAIGNLDPFVFTLSLVPASLFGSIIGPARTNLIIDQLKGDTGAASSLMSCAYTLFGSIGMLIISLIFESNISNGTDVCCNWRYKPCTMDDYCTKNHILNTYLIM